MLTVTTSVHLAPTFLLRVLRVSQQDGILWIVPCMYRVSRCSPSDWAIDTVSFFRTLCGEAARLRRTTSSPLQRPTLRARHRIRQPPVDEREPPDQRNLHVDSDIREDV
jgi:hypothetical protein